MIFRIFIFLLLSSCTKESYQWYNGSIAKALSKISNEPEKILFLDFYSENWGACVRLDAETLSNQAVITFSKQNFISIKLKPWTDEDASELFNSFNGTGIPLLLYLNGDGIEIDRIAGYYPADEYLKKITDIYNGVDTFLSLKNSFISGSRTSEMLSKLSEKCKSSADVEFCNSVYLDIIDNNSNLDSAVVFTAELFFAKNQLNKDGTPSEMIRLINKHDNLDYQKDAYQTLVYHYQRSGEMVDEAKIYKEFSDKFNADSNILNGYAWRMTELKLNLEDALIKSTLAAQLTAENPENQANILDTKAEILWLLDRYEEAIDVINLAIDINSDSDYFREQKIKFQNSKKE